MGDAALRLAGPAHGTSSRSQSDARSLIFFGGVNQILEFADPITCSRRRQAKSVLEKRLQWREL